jgi:hypothetical protein
MFRPPLLLPSFRLPLLLPSFRLPLLLLSCRLFLPHHILADKYNNRLYVVRFAFVAEHAKDRGKFMHGQHVLRASVIVK